VTRREQVVAGVARLACATEAHHPVRTAVDGVTASGKSTFAAELAAAVSALGRPPIHVTMDGFHHPRAHRHRRGRGSAVGYYEDAYDFGALAEHVLLPLGPGADCRYRTAIIDLDSDEAVEEESRLAPANAVVIVDGSFLQRPETDGLWDQRVFLHTDLSVARERGLRRDSAALGGETAAAELYDARYHAAARLYLAAVDPVTRADIVVDNNDLAAPRIVRP
jgi:uridine kinase